MDEKKLKKVKQILDLAEENIREARKILFENEIQKQANGLEQSADAKIVEGVFDGEFMICGDGKKYPVPQNYVSKSKLVVGDVLKLTILEDGTFVFKQIGPIERKKLIGILEQISENKYQVICDGEHYNVILASVTYYKGKVGDQVTIIVPKVGSCQWAAIENIIPQK